MIFFSDLWFSETFSKMLYQVSRHCLLCFSEIGHDVTMGDGHGLKGWPWHWRWLILAVSPWWDPRESVGFGL